MEEQDEMAQDFIVLGGGCFWCVEAVYVELKGVLQCESGYAGGHVPNPTYEQVCTGLTGHAEVVKITYDPKIISPRDILRVFFTVHDPTTPNQQGNDHGPQYRSVIFVRNPEEKALAQEVMTEVTKARIWPRRLVTTLEPLTKFYRAEDYHQNYFEKFQKAGVGEKMQMNAGYCQYIIAPKVAKFRKMYADKLKK